MGRRKTPGDADGTDHGPTASVPNAKEPAQEPQTAPGVDSPAAFTPASDYTSAALLEALHGA